MTLVDPDPREIVVDDITQLTDYPTDHGGEVTARNLALWILAMIESDPAAGEIRVVVGPGRAGITSMTIEPSGDGQILVLR